MTPHLAGYGRVVGLVASAWMSRSSDILQSSIAAGVGVVFACRIGADLAALYRAQATVEKIQGIMAPRWKNDK